MFFQGQTDMSDKWNTILDNISLGCFPKSNNIRAANVSLNSKIIEYQLSHNALQLHKLMLSMSTGLLIPFFPFLTYFKVISLVVLQLCWFCRESLVICMV